MVEASYVGNHGTQLQTSRNLNATPNQYLSTLPVRDADRIAYLTANIPNPFFGLLPTTAAAGLQGDEHRARAAAASVPAVRFGQHDDQRRLVLVSRGAVQPAAAVLERVHARIELHLLEVHRGDRVPERRRPRAVGGHLERRLSAPADGQRHPGAALRTRPPLRRGQSTPCVSAFISGWQVAGIYTYQSGFPIGFGNIIFTGNLDDIDIPTSEQTLARWFNTDAGFNKNSAQALDRNVRTFPLRLENVRTDNVSNIDLSIIKNTQVAGKTIEFRFESLNAFNHPYFPGPHTNPTAVAFGTISASTQLNYARRTQISLKFLF